MKKGIVLILMVSNTALAQLAVLSSDPAQMSFNLVDQVLSQTKITEAIRQTALLQKQLSTLKKTAEFVKKVNQRVKTVYYISEMEKIIRNTIRVNSRSMIRLRDSNQFSVNELGIISSNFARVIMASNRVIGLGNRVIATNDLKMDDFQRVERLNQSHKDLLALNREMRAMNAQYEYMAQRRRFYRAFQ